MGQHTPGPYERAIVGDALGTNNGDGQTIAIIGQISGEPCDVAYVPPSAEQEGDTARVLACLNGCRGINPEAVPALLEVVKGALRIVDLWLPKTADEEHREEVVALHCMHEAFRAALAKATENQD